jgi:hypothetical protein
MTTSASEITEATRAKIRTAIEADPERWRTPNGNKNGPREITIDGHELAIAWDPLDHTTAVYVATPGGYDEVTGI